VQKTIATGSISARFCNSRSSFIKDSNDHYKHYQSSQDCDHIEINEEYLTVEMNPSGPYSIRIRQRSAIQLTAKEREQEAEQGSRHQRNY